MAEGSKKSLRLFFVCKNELYGMRFSQFPFYQPSAQENKMIDIS